MAICSCSNREKRFEDYNEEDFILVQGIVTKITRTPIIRFVYYETNVHYIYDLDSDCPKRGIDFDVQYLGKEGGPAIILVHKYESGISFFGRGGILPQGKEVLEKYLSKEAIKH